MRSSTPEEKRWSMKRSGCPDEDELSTMKRSCCHDEDELSKTKSSRLSSPSCHDGLVKMKRSSRTSYYSRRYHYEYELSEDDNSSVDPLESTVLDLVSTVRINFRANYILRKRKLSGGDVDETLDSIERCFFMRLYLITGFKDYCVRESSLEVVQLREDMEYDVNMPERFLSKFFVCHGVRDADVIQNLIENTKDFVSRKRSWNNRVLPITGSIKVYTLQQEDETIDDAKQRAITMDLLKVERRDRLIKLLQRPPAYKFMIEFEDDHEMLRGGCCICLSKLSVGEEVLLLSCSHAYHYRCLIRWLYGANRYCPLCRCPMNLANFMEAFRYRFRS